MNRQLAFNTAVLGLWNQQAFSMNDEGVCAYRGEHGNKCAVGFLIPDDDYTEELDSVPGGMDVSVSLVQKAIDDQYGPVDVPFLNEMQREIHDKLANAGYGWSDRAFIRAVTAFAEEHDLTIPTEELTR